MGGVALGEISGIVRCGDRVRMNAALGQLKAAILRTQDLDEARGTALTFVAMVTAATLEMGGPRAMHRVQLDAARAFDQVKTTEEISETADRFVHMVCGSMFDEDLTTAKLLIDRSLAYLDRNYHRDLNDDMVARELGLSTSHFRHLFREATGQPFRKYLIAVRLERARRLLVESDLAVSDIALEVGFSGLAHFSRAFAQRFAATPSSIRRGAMVAAARQ